VAVDIQRDRDAGMPEPFLHNLGMDVGREHVGGVTMPQAVQCYAPFL
jgi:hypothetical protein